MLTNQVVAVSDPRLDIKPKIDVALKGGRNISWQQYQPNQISNSSVQVTCDPPNKQIGVCRCPLARATYSVTITFTNSSSPAIAPLQNGYWGVRNKPYTSTVSSHQISLNNDLYAVSPVNQFNRALAHYYEDHDERFTSMSTTGSMLDQFQNYSDGLLSGRNPLQPYSNNPYDQTRNDYNVGQGSLISGVTGNTAGSTSVSFSVNVSEPLMFLAPLSQGINGYYNNVIFGVDKMTYSATYSNLNRILSISDSLPSGIAITNVSVNLTSFNLLFQYIKPSLSYQKNLPAVIDYPYYNMVLYQSNGTSTAPNGSVVITSGNLDLVGYPRRIYLWAGPPDSIYNSDPTSFTRSDVFFALQSLTLTFNTDQYLAAATQQDLYNISVKNGNRLSWVQWSNAMGSVLCLDLAEDIGLASDEAAGLQDKVQIQFNATLKNTNQSLTITPQLNTLVIYDGILKIDHGFVSRKINTLSRSDIDNATYVNNIKYEDMQNLYGGSFFGNIWSGIKKVASPLASIARPIAKVAQTFKPAISTALDIASSRYGPAGRLARLGVKKLTGYGGRYVDDHREGGYAMTGGDDRGSAMIGGNDGANVLGGADGGADGGAAMVGGKGYMTKAEMMHNMNTFN